jgi:hypothetical protein
VINRFAQAAASLVYFILRISKEASPTSVLGRVWCGVSFRTCLAGLSVLLHKENCILFFSRVSAAASSSRRESQVLDHGAQAFARGAARCFVAVT